MTQEPGKRLVSPADQSKSKSSETKPAVAAPAVQPQEQAAIEAKAVEALRKRQLRAARMEELFLHDPDDHFTWFLSYGGEVKQITKKG